MADLTLKPRSLRVQAEEFWDYLDDWIADLLPLPLPALVAEAGGPEHIGIFCVDVINGFCYEGPLQSLRVRAIIPPIVRLFEAAYAIGVPHFVLAHDAHDPAAAEFVDYPPHCIRGTSESQVVPELMDLPFADRYTLVPKNCLHSGVGTTLNAWLDGHPEVTHRIVVGDCTDLCTYQLAMHLKMRANATNRIDPVILPADCVDTYDIPVDTARTVGIPAHPAEVCHRVFLFNMASNGIRVVSNIDPLA